MAHAKKQDMKALVAVVHDAAKGLSRHAVAALIAHPDAVQSALAVTAHALSLKEQDEDIEIINGARPRLVSAEEAERRLAEHTVPAQEENLLTSEELAERAGLKTRQSVHDWLRKGRIIGWQRAKRGYVFPAEQLDDRGHPLKGLERIMPYFADGYAAWGWLTTPLEALDDETPLMLLREGEIDLAVSAAAGDAQGDFG